MSDPKNFASFQPRCSCSSRRKTLESVSYAVYGAGSICYVNHDTTKRMRTKDGTDLAPLLKLEQQANPNRPIHVL